MKTFIEFLEAVKSRKIDKTIRDLPITYQKWIVVLREKFIDLMVTVIDSYDLPDWSSLVNKIKRTPIVLQEEKLNNLNYYLNQVDKVDEQIRKGDPNGLVNAQHVAWMICNVIWYGNKEIDFAISDVFNAAENQEF